jgi:hypothetical protein
MVYEEADEHQGAQRRVEEPERGGMNRRRGKPGRWLCKTLGRTLMLTCYVSVGAMALMGQVVAGSIPFGVVHTAPQVTVSHWKHKGLVEELQSLTKSNLERVSELSVNAEQLVLEVDKLKRLLGSQQPSVEPVPLMDGECPDWVDALGSASPAEAETDSWIDGSSSAVPTPPGEGLSHNMYKYG